MAPVGIPLVDYRFVLRHRMDTVVAQLTLPMPLTAEDVRRLSAFLQTLVQEEPADDTECA
jgi:hypothetical protein